MKCRTRRALDFRTHIAASGLSRGFVCLRVGMKLNTLYKSCRVCRTYCCCTRQTLPTPDHILCTRHWFGYVVLLTTLLTYTAGHHTSCRSSVTGQRYKTRTSHYKSRSSQWSTVLDRMLVKLPTLTFLSTSDQARLPAKFKHINKRWKRNQKGYPE